jgi:DNA invertase Pin-like site-specific DNA recombinase
VSTTDQQPENQLLALRSFAMARGWSAVEFVDHGVSGTKERRPQLDAMLAAVRSRKVDVVVVVKLDRLARSLHHLVALGQELQALGLDLVAIDQAVDSTTPSGRLLFGLLGAVAEFERDLIRDRVMAGLRRARAAGVRVGRPKRLIKATHARRLLSEGKSLRQVAKELNVGASHFPLAWLECGLSTEAALIEIWRILVWRRRVRFAHLVTSE